MLEEKEYSTHYLRTDKAIVSAFCLLLEEKPYEEITIQDILDATPISRAAFYQHFQDKDAIGEQLMREYFKAEAEIIQKMGQVASKDYAGLVQGEMKNKTWLVRALMKIHTPKVDLATAVCQSMEQFYLSKSASEFKEMEAKIYARAMAEFQLQSICNLSAGRMGDVDVFNETMINVFLRIMNWSEDKGIKSYLLAHVS